VNDVVLPGGTPSRVGTFGEERAGERQARTRCRRRAARRQAVLCGPIKSDGVGPPDRLVFGDVQVWVHQSGERPAIRIRDKAIRCGSRSPA
jgi:hypothetical protein